MQHAGTYMYKASMTCKRVDREQERDLQAPEIAEQMGSKVC